MNSISPCQRFFCHPLHESHSCATKTLSIITTIVLTILTAGIYLIVLCSMQDREVSVVGRSLEDKYVGNEALKAKHQEFLARFEQWAAQGEWENMQGPRAHFDWWMFPYDRPSAGQGKRYQLSVADRNALKTDAEFMARYRRGVTLVVRSWGWDLRNGVDCSNEQQRWTGYGVRLWKMVKSLEFFEEWELLQRVRQFIAANGIQIRS